MERFQIEHTPEIGAPAFAPDAPETRADAALPV